MILFREIFPQLENGIRGRALAQMICPSFKRRSAFSVSRLRKQIDEAKCQTEFSFFFLQSLASGK